MIDEYLTANPFEDEKNDVCPNCGDECEGEFCSGWCFEESQL